MQRQRLQRRVRRRRSTARSSASASTASRNRTRRASRCWSTSRRGSSCHHPAAFCAALLNSQPMGFYAPAQLVQDARRHGVEVRPPDVNASDWDCTLEDGALRLGLRMVSGLSETEGRRIAAGKALTRSIARAEARAARTCARSPPPARCNRSPGTAASRTGRRPARRGARRSMRLETSERRSSPRPSEGEDIVADYASLGLTLGRHPLALLRDRLGPRRPAQRRGDARAAPRQRGARGGAGHLPPAPRHGERRGVRHAGGRDRQRQRRGLAPPGRDASAASCSARACSACRA